MAGPAVQAFLGRLPQVMFPAWFTEQEGGPHER
jgi:hypothetical protein